MNKDHKKTENIAQEQVDKTQEEQLVACVKELDVWKGKFLRVTADLQNFKKRMEKERVQWMQIAQSQIVNDLLAIIDDFERASEQKEKQELAPETEELFSGFAMIGKALEKVLLGHGLKEISDVENFDPELHEAIAQIPSEDCESGQIVQVLQKGYRFKEQVIRPAKVTVAK